MAKINLRNIYPYYKQDYFIEVSDEVTEALFHFERSSHAHERKIRRHKAYYSLDRADGIEKDIVFLMCSPEEIYEHKMAKRELYFAMATLPEKQASKPTQNITSGKAGGVYPFQGDSKRLLFRILVFPCASGLQCLCKTSDAP